MARAIKSVLDKVLASADGRRQAGDLQDLERLLGFVARLPGDRQGST